MTEQMKEDILGSVVWFIGMFIIFLFAWKVSPWFGLLTLIFRVKTRNYKNKKPSRSQS